MKMRRWEYDAVLHETPDNGGAYVAFPRDLRGEFGKGRLKVHAAFDGIPYDGSIVNMGVKNPDGPVCYVIGVRKAIRERLNKHDGDAIHVVIEAEVAQRPEDYESEERFRPEFVDPETAILRNRRIDHGPHKQVGIERETSVLELLISEGYFR